MQFEEMVGRLRRARRILVTTHQAPDGDGVGCQLALLQMLDRLGVAGVAVNDGPVPPRFGFLPGAARARDWGALDASERAAALAGVDLAVAVDTHAWAMLGSLEPVLRARSFPTLFVDHHPVLEPERADVLCDSEASSAGEVCWRLLGRLGVPLTAEAATCLYAAIAYDTNSFKYLRGRAEPHLAAAGLIACGADAESVYRNVFAAHSAGKVAFVSELLRSIRRAEDPRVSWAVVPRDLVARTGVTRDDLRDAVTHLLEVDGVEVAVMFHERDDASYKVSLRSKGNFPVSQIARALDGGGHHFAAGAHAAGPLPELRERVFALIRDLLSRPAPPASA
jgi:phosphoesterase RecJ-like protein